MMLILQTNIILLKFSQIFFQSILSFDEKIPIFLVSDFWKHWEMATRARSRCLVIVSYCFREKHDSHLRATDKATQYEGRGPFCSFSYGCVCSPQFLFPSPSSSFPSSASSSIPNLNSSNLWIGLDSGLKS